MTMHTNEICASILILLCCNILLSPTSASHHRQWYTKWDEGFGLQYKERPNGIGLRVGFYDETCPQAEQIVQEAVRQGISREPGIGAGLLRMYFHDCFVNGCDASILLDYTPSGEPTEKTSPGNVGLRGFEIIDFAKTRLEEECPDTVSCADIIAFATRDAVTQYGVAHYAVPSGRRDGVTSLASNLESNIPPPDDNVDRMLKTFTKKGLNITDLVVLLGAHSVGVAHCSTIDTDFYNFNGTNMANPKLDESYTANLKQICPPPNSPTSKDSVLPLNPLMTNVNCLTNEFYVNVLQGKAVFQADQSLLDNQITYRLVNKFSGDLNGWAYKFRKAMVKLGNVDVLTGENGEIRQTCRAVNQY